MSRILVMPGTYWVLDLCKRIKELGHQIYLVDPNYDCPCREYADVYLQSDIFDWDIVYAFAKENKVNAVMSDECDIAMPMVSKLGEALGLGVQDTSTVRYFTDKYIMREFCKEQGLRNPEYKLCRTLSDAKHFFEQLACPIIIKPVDSNASRGVFKIDSVSELEAHFDEALMSSRAQKVVLAERYIVGREFTIDGIKTKNSHYTLAISKKSHFNHNSNIANELYFSYRDQEYDYDKLRLINDDYIMKSGLKFGFTHAEYKYEDGEYYLIEIACRGGGNKISSVITQYLSGYQTYDYLIRASLGSVENTDYSIKDCFKDRCAVLRFFETPGNGGRVNEIQGIDYLKNTPDIMDWKLNFEVGDMIEPAKNDSARIGYYIACSDSKIKLDKVIQDVDTRIKFIIGE